MRALWLAAPLALIRHAAIFAAVVTAAALAVAAASSAPFVRAGVKSSALRGQVKLMSPLAAGFQVRTTGPLRDDLARRRAAAAFARAHGFDRPVLASQVPAVVQSNNFDVVVMARTGASAHVKHLEGHDEGGVWISRIIAETTGLRPGDTLALSEDPRFTQRPPVVRVRIAGVYEQLDADFGNPYWANWVQEISTRNPNDPPLPTFVLMPEQTFLRVAHALRQTTVRNTFEYPVSATNITYVDAEHLAHTYDQLGRELAPKQTGSSISAALLVAEQQIGALSTTISLLSTAALTIAALIAAAAGVFLVRRRFDEAQLLFARGEAPWWFALRTALEAVLPALVGFALGYGGSIAALTLFAPAGTLDHGTLVAGALHGLGAAAAAVALLALVAGMAFPRLPHRSRFGRRLRAIPWEVGPLAAAGALVGLLLSGSALARDAHGSSHPRLVVFLLPAVGGAGLAGLAARATRRVTQRRGTNALLPLFLVLRRVAAARGLLIAVAVSATTAFAVYGYAQTLSSSLTRSAAQKAYIGNGSDVQGLIDPTERIFTPFPFPATTAQVDTNDVVIGQGNPLVLVSGNPSELRNVLQWGNWSNDPRAHLQQLADATAPPGVLPVIASPDFPHVGSINDQGVSIPLKIVARSPVPGAIGGWPALLADATTLHAVAKAHHIDDPAPQAGAVIWARGDPRVIEPALERSNLRPSFLTTLSFIRNDPSVVAAARSYRYLRAIGIAAVVLALTSLLLYLQARQRGQRLASALLRRMGLPARTDVVTLALEAAAITAASCVLGELVAAAASRLVVPHIDPLPQYSPGTTVIYPWTTLIWVGAAGAVAAGLFAAVAVALARRGSVAEELRVA